MRHLNLLVSNLLLPQEVSAQLFSGLELPALEKLLARSESSVLPGYTLEDSLCAQFSSSAVAPTRAAADGLDASAGYWVCADPVNLQLQQSQVILRPDVSCEAAEATALCAVLNAHFAEDGLTFYAPHPQRWYIHSANPSDVAFRPLRLAAWRDVKLFQPQGAQALVWKRLSNEIQMLLHENVINLTREANGLPAINSLWLWGAGQSTPLSTSLDTVGGDEALSAAFAKASGLRVVTSMAELLDVRGAQACWVNTTLGTAWQRGDWHAWRDALQALEREIALPVWQALRSGKLQTLTLEVALDSGIFRYELNRAGIWKVWRWPKPLSAYDVTKHSKFEGS